MVADVSLLAINENKKKIMNFAETMRALGTRFEVVSPTAEACAKIQEAIATEHFDKFFEPVAVVDATNNKRRLLGIEPEYLFAWTRHIAYSTRLKITHLENAVADLLLHEQYLPSLVLTRSHLESSGMAALCLDTLTDCMRDRNVEALERLIPQSLFGTSLYRLGKKDPVTQGLLLTVQGETVTAKNLVDALTKFANSTGGNGDSFARFYSLLCEFSHSNFGGTAEFRRVIEARPDGWVIQYSDSYDRQEESVVMALEILLASMKAGHAACKMLSVVDFAVAGEEVRYQGPSETDMRWIWDAIINV